MEAEKLILTDEHSGRVYRIKQKKIAGVVCSYLWLYKTAIEKKDSYDGNNIVNFQRG